MEPPIPQIGKEPQHQEYEEKKKETQVFTNGHQINPMITPIIQLPQQFQPIYSPISFSWGNNFLSK